MNSIKLKSEAELELMRESGRLLADVFMQLNDWVQPGVTSMALNDRVEAYIVEVLKARPASKGQYDYPYVLNASINEEVCHGMPDHRRLKSGQIINLDITLEKNGFIADSSKMYLVGEVSPQARRLVKTTYEALWTGIRMVRPGARLGDVGHAIQQYAQAAGYSVVREYCGHGIGREMHEAPQVLHFGIPGTGVVLEPGMTFTIEPMLNQGSHKVRTLSDDWTVVTRDGQLSAQWEHTLAVTESGVEVLTLRPEETHLLASSSSRSLMSQALTKA
ncbi:type I methionyl aminopeptidase [Marinospirillum alkaliphilum]|uniref:Methionine aminopeptidase n=1 Tax=Marinospirillum alkaliphilum DSM 21637 TaxID=1122209 RepID=A0A1K1YIA3_9GAMM|nr:type I methionyl aminopeptidase [Marinospirillum alkaliphilum]SFX61681.1 methionyl aminopeptidase [Marinospirillum alkaliphilum DSM 21637]